MTSTLSTYHLISNNMAQWQKLTTSEPLTKAQTEYYQKNIGNIKTPKVNRAAISKPRTM